MIRSTFAGEDADLPVLATAIHDGHLVRGEAARQLALEAPARAYEEDPFTGLLASICPRHLVVHTSRFEVDLNRPRARCVYLAPDQAWGLTVWKPGRPTRHVLERSRAAHDGFYRDLRGLLDGMRERFGRFAVIDVHSYNHKRQGPAGPAADPAGNPDVDIDVEASTLERWSPLIRSFESALRRADPVPLDVRENVRFDGPGRLSSWINRRYGDRACSIAVEFKKTYMDEWSGFPDARRLFELRRALGSAITEIAAELNSAGGTTGGAKLPPVR